MTRLVDRSTPTRLFRRRVPTIERLPERVSLDQLLTVLMALEAEIIVQARVSSARSDGDKVAW